MAVIGSTDVSFCLYCKRTSERNTKKEFHEIYDEVGLELQLPSLVEKFFHIVLLNKGEHRLCDDCVNRLIELYDLEEHAKEKKGQEILADNATESIESSRKNKPATLFANTNSNDTEKLKNVYIEENNPSICEKEYDVLSGQRDYINKVVILNQTENVGYEGKELLYGPSIKATTPYNEKEKSETLTNENICSINNMLVVVEPEKIVHDSLVENIDCSFDAENNYNPNTITGTEIPIEEFEVIENSQTELNSSAGCMDFANDHDDRIEDPVIYEEETLTETSMRNSENELYEELVLEELSAGELDEGYHMGEEFRYPQEQENNPSGDVTEGFNSLKETDEIVLEINTKALESSESGGEISIDKDFDDKIDKFCTEEEYLIEEMNCSQEYDCIDLNDYLDKALTTKFKDLDLIWEIECKFCLEKYNKFQDLLNHACLIELIEGHQCHCIIKDCGENLNDLNSLARHLILQHYGELENIPIYGRCPDCQKTFCNFIEFNKHSCCRTIKRKAGARNYCTSCDLDFQSMKRFVFHMQFHLTNHRPKICLLCGSLFNNSNEFFEHTQYEHNPNGTMACKKCDRFFREKEVYDSHMESHEEPKFSCSYCPKKYTKRCGLRLHMGIYHNHKHKPLQCEYCDKQFVNNASYRNHMKSHIPDVQIESLICSECGLLTNNMDFIKDHVELDPESPCFSAVIQEDVLAGGYTCENCSIDFISIKHLKQHRLSGDHSDKVFYCGMCRQEFKTLRHMRNHAINHKEYEQWEEAYPITRFFVCNIGDCEEFYPLWTSLYYHKKRPHKTANDLKSAVEFKCQFCQQLCTSKMSLAIHVARSHNNSNVRCIQCGQTYKTQKLLQKHIDKFHTEVKCGICFKMFKNRRNFEIHNHSVHLNEKRYFCQYCNKGYFHKSEKDAHEKQVHPDTSYRCELCNFVTNYPKSLEIHLDKHNNQLKFKCTICTKSFGRKQLLSVHMKRHQDKKDYKCRDYYGDSSCDAAFITYNLLKTHIKKDHQDQDSNKMQKTVKRKRSSKKYLEIVEIEHDTTNFANGESADDCTYDKQPKRTSGACVIDAKSEKDIIEETEISVDDDDFIIQYENGNSSE